MHVFLHMTTYYKKRAFHSSGEKLTEGELLISIMHFYHKLLNGKRGFHFYNIIRVRSKKPVTNDFHTQVALTL